MPQILRLIWLPIGPMKYNMYHRYERRITKYFSLKLPCVLRSFESSFKSPLPPLFKLYIYRKKIELNNVRVTFIFLSQHSYTRITEIYARAKGNCKVCLGRRNY